MTRKSCLNCAYLFANRFISNGEVPKSKVTVQQRQKGQEFDAIAHINSHSSFGCYHNQWQNIHIHAPDEQFELLSSRRKCPYFHKFDPDRTKPFSPLARSKNRSTGSQRPATVYYHDQSFCDCCRCRHRNGSSSTSLIGEAANDPCFLS